MDSITKFFQSKKLATILIILIILFSIIGLQIPQKVQLKPEVYNAWKTSHPLQAEIFEYIGFTHLYSSPIFIILTILLFINTLFCTKNMLKKSIKLSHDSNNFRNKEYITTFKNHEIISVKNHEKMISEISSVLSSFGYKVYIDKNRIFARKNRFGVFGTFLFHICILLIILFVIYGSTGRMEGDMRLIEGQTLSESHENYMFINEGIFFNENHQKFNITFEKFYPDYYDSSGTPRGGAAKILISKNGKNIKSDIIYSNKMMSYKGYTILGNVYGLAPLLLLKDSNDKLISGSYITASDLDDSQRYVASFDIADTGLKGKLMVYMAVNITSNKKEPKLFLKIYDKDIKIYDSSLKLNESANIPEYNLKLVFYDIKYWSNFYVVKDRSIKLIMFSVFLMILSLFINFFVISKKIWVEITDNKIYIGAKSDKFKSLYTEEFNKLVSKINLKFRNT